MSDQLSEQERQQVQRAFERTSEQGWGLALGFLAALGLFVATVFLVIKGGEVIGPRLQLLSVYLPGYTVTWTGAFIGAAYMFFLGYGAGRIVATVYNLCVRKQ
jgi:hypothetical protein